ncbi:DUF2202 domain-containing protein [Ornithinimicrobium sp. W1679]|uniref:DUF2202 domain-containing protein n=1 Tax=Ornithinimicrobium sp. W1679 TaxID=3418770 RepID=UPI003CFAB331
MSTLLATGVGTALALGTGVAIAQSDDGTDEGGTATEVLDALQFNLEEERMARDLYDELGEAHDGLAPFTQIEVSEQRHHDAVAQLITLKDGTLPENEVPGEFENDEIQTMYDDWLERGLVSPEAAFEVGIELETADIAHLQSTIDEIDDEDVDRVLGHLLSASEHHLAAFEAAAAGELPDMAGTGGGRQGGPGSGMQPGDRGQGMRQGMQQGPGGADPGLQQGPGGQRGPGMGGPGAQQGQGGQHHGNGTGDCPMTTTEDADDA